MNNKNSIRINNLSFAYRNKEIFENVIILNNEIYAKCKIGTLKINIIQKSGKNKLSSKDFLNGLKL